MGNFRKRLDRLEAKFPTLEQRARNEALQRLNQDELVTFVRWVQATSDGKQPSPEHEAIRNRLAELEKTVEAELRAASK